MKGRGGLVRDVYRSMNSVEEKRQDRKDKEEGWKGK